MYQTQAVKATTPDLNVDEPIAENDENIEE